ncbi:hypothetical protein M0802_009766 [Mischocyttarus mexicanus]|nr:hypothetical protein M0802_009766 [Mischocyttarus mexicanus]
MVVMVVKNAETKSERLGGGGCADASHKHGRLIARSPSPTPCSHTRMQRQNRKGLEVEVAPMRPISTAG